MMNLVVNRESGEHQEQKVHSVTPCTVHVSETVWYIQCVRVYRTYCVVTPSNSDGFDELQGRNSVFVPIAL